MLERLSEEVGVVAVVLFPDFGEDIHFGVHHEALTRTCLEEVDERGGRRVGGDEGEFSFGFQCIVDWFEEPSGILHQAFSGGGRGDDEGHEVGVIGMLVDAVKHFDVGEGVAACGEGGKEEHVLLLWLGSDKHGALEKRRELPELDVGAEVGA